MHLEAKTFHYRCLKIALQTPASDGFKLTTTPHLLAVCKCSLHQFIFFNFLTMTMY